MPTTRRGRGRYFLSPLSVAVEWPSRPLDADAKHRPSGPLEGGRSLIGLFVPDPGATQRSANRGDVGGVQSSLTRSAASR
jgi:hypothetical protein